MAFSFVNTMSFITISTFNNNVRMSKTFIVLRQTPYTASRVWYVLCFFAQLQFQRFNTKSKLGSAGQIQGIPEQHVCIVHVCKCRLYLYSSLEKSSFFLPQANWNPPPFFKVAKFSDEKFQGQGVLISDLKTSLSTLITHTQFY